MTRDFDAVLAEAVSLLGEAGDLRRKARRLRHELEAARATGAADAERLVHGTIAAGIEQGRVQGLEAALQELRGAQHQLGVMSRGEVAEASTRGTGRAMIAMLPSAASLR
jgi:hypothetical protein